ncbi:MAG: carboxypeptidase-like regulatory domain-containing protein [Pseudomonadota bacterium]
MMNAVFQQRFFLWLSFLLLCLINHAAFASNIQGEIKLPTGIAPDAQPVQLYVIAWGNLTTGGQTQLVFQEPLGIPDDAIANSTTTSKDIIGFLNTLDVFGNIGTMAGVEPIQIQSGQTGANYNVMAFNRELPTSVSYLCVNNCSPFQQAGFYSNSAETTSNQGDRAQLQAGQDFSGIDLTLLTGGAIFGSVLNAQGVSLEGASVFARDAGNLQQQFMALSNAEGGYFLNVLPNKAYQMLVSHPMLGELNENIIVQIGVGSVQQDFQYPEAMPGVIEGVVRGPDGQPLDDAVISAFGFNNGGMGLVDFRITQTGVDGRYRLENLLADTYDLIVWHKRFGSLPAVMVRPAPPAEQNFQFSAGKVIFGTVYGPDGQPVKNARVNARGDTLFDFRGARTDENGQYALESLQSDNYVMRVFHPRFGTLESASDGGQHPVSASLDGTARDFTFPTRLTISGRVLGGPTDWRGVSGFVGVYQDDGDGIFDPRKDRFWDCAFVNGSYQSVPVPPGKYFISPVVRGYSFDAAATVSLGGIVNGDSREVELLDAPLTDVDLAIRSNQVNGTINGVVTNPNNIDNISFIEVSILTGGTVVDSFSATVGDDFVIENLDPGQTYTIFAHAFDSAFNEVGKGTAAGISGNNGNIQLILAAP